jgi:Leucine-rich repeat (LRR) protein
MKISLLFFLVSFVYGTEIPCVFGPPYAVNYCTLFTDGSVAIHITLENEAITVTGNPPNGFDSINYAPFHSPFKLNFIPTRMFETMKNLKEFQAVGVELTTLTSNAFTNCLMMEKIYMDYNNFPEIPSGFAQSCSALRYLQLEYCHVKAVDKDAFKGLTNLEEIMLNVNEIAVLDPQTFIHTPNLKWIYFNNNVLTAIHPDLFATLSPQYVSFERNQIQSLPAIHFSTMSNLESISFHQNSIKKMDRRFFQDYVNLQENFEIIFTFNDCINDAFKSPTKPVLMNDPSLQGCFDNWDNSFTTTTSTSITTITTAIATTSKLTPSDNCDSHRDCRFYLDHEKVYVCVLENVDLILSSIGGQHEIIDQKTFADADVKAVYFKHSILSKVPRKIFEKFPNIDFLSVIECKMTIINENTFELCGNLKTLDASKNSILRITKTSLKNCQSLETMIMTGNLELEEIESELFSVDPKLKHIVLNRRG